MLVRVPLLWIEANPFQTRTEYGDVGEQVKGNLDNLERIMVRLIEMHHRGDASTQDRERLAGWIEELQGALDVSRETGDG